MNNIFPNPKLSSDQPGRSNAFHGNLQPLRRVLPTDLRAPIWSGLLASLIALGMLLAFYQFVDEAVHQSELRHQASARQAQASWRCNSLGGPGASSSCLAQLNSAALTTVADQSLFDNAQTGSTLKFINAPIKGDSTFD